MVRCSMVMNSGVSESLCGLTSMSISPSQKKKVARCQRLYCVRYITSNAIFGEYNHFLGQKFSFALPKIGYKTTRDSIQLYREVCDVLHIRANTEKEMVRQRLNSVKVWTREERLQSLMLGRKL